MSDKGIKTAGDLRSFLADVMMDIRAGRMEAEDAGAISKIAAQINQSLAVEVNTALQLEKMGKPGAVAGTMLIGRQDDTNIDPRLQIGSDGMVWCEQCDAQVTPEDATACKSKFCKAKGLEGAV